MTRRSRHRPPLDAPERVFPWLFALALLSMAASLLPVGSARWTGPVPEPIPAAWSALALFLVALKWRQRSRERHGAPRWLTPLVVPLPTSTRAAPAIETGLDGRLAVPLCADLTAPIEVAPGERVDVPTGLRIGAAGSGDPELQAGAGDTAWVPVAFAGFATERGLEVTLRNDADTPRTIAPGAAIARIVFGPCPASRSEVLAARADPVTLVFGLLQVVMAMAAVPVMSSGLLGAAIPVADAKGLASMIGFLGYVAISASVFAAYPAGYRESIVPALLASGGVGCPLAFVVSATTSGDPQRWFTATDYGIAIAIQVTLIAAVVALLPPRWRPGTSPPAPRRPERRTHRPC